MNGVTCVILAAGTSSRMGTPKLLLPLGDGIVLDRAIAACAGLPTVIVASPVVAAHLQPDRAAPDSEAHAFTMLVNQHPERGMTHSLRLAGAAIDPEHGVIVVPADFPFLTRDLVAAVAGAEAADIAYPAVSGDGEERPGHPVRFGPRARALLSTLPDGDTLRTLRDADTLTRTIACQASPDSQRDIDEAEDYAQARERIIHHRN